jgi:hypothetical protein
VRMEGGMQWVSLNTRQLRAASYDADRQQLRIKTSAGSIRTHQGVLPHMFNNLLNSDEQDFCYRIYIESSLVSDRRGVASIARHYLKIGIVGTGVLLLSASGLLI